VLFAVLSAAALNTADRTQNSELSYVFIPPMTQEWTQCSKLTVFFLHIRFSILKFRCISCFLNAFYVNLPSRLSLLPDTNSITYWSWYVQVLPSQKYILYRAAAYMNFRSVRAREDKWYCILEPPQILAPYIIPRGTRPSC